MDLTPSPINPNDYIDMTDVIEISDTTPILLDDRATTLPDTTPVIRLPILEVQPTMEQINIPVHIPETDLHQPTFVPEADIPVPDPISVEQIDINDFIHPDTLPALPRPILQVEADPVDISIDDLPTVQLDTSVSDNLDMAGDIIYEHAINNPILEGLAHHVTTNYPHLNNIHIGTEGVTAIQSDGTRVMFRNGPTGGSLNDVRREDLVIASTDPVLADAAALPSLGRAEESIPYLAMAAQAGLGRLKPRWKRDLSRPPSEADQRTHF